MSPVMATMAILGGLGLALTFWALMVWRDSKIRQRQDEALRQFGPYRHCDVCDGTGWIERHSTHSNWTRCPRCHGWGRYRYLEAL